MTKNYDLFGNINVAERLFGQQLKGAVLKTHAEDACVGEFCCIHNPSDHALKDAPLNWRGDRGLMERICEHGVGHPDPDDLAYKERVMSKEDFEMRAFGTHGCCLCCVEGKQSV